jgi:hypothetical protein
MRKLSELSLVLFLFVVGCTKVNQPIPINLGKEATSTAITHLSTTVTKGDVDVTMNVTPGAKYSIQLIDLKGDVKSSTGFTADKELITKKLNYSDVNSGDYTITLIDILGKEYKRSLTIKK